MNTRSRQLPPGVDMNAATALRQYQRVDTQVQVADASPHRLIQMLLEGAMARLFKARGAMEHGQVELKGPLISSAISIIGGLREALDLSQGGEVAENLASLYDYMSMRLVQANVHSSVETIDEVLGLLRNIKTAWDAIEPYGE